MCTRRTDSSAINGGAGAVCAQIARLVLRMMRRADRRIRSIILFMLCKVILSVPGDDGAHISADCGYVIKVAHNMSNQNETAH